MYYLLLNTETNRGQGVQVLGHQRPRLFPFVTLPSLTHDVMAWTTMTALAVDMICGFHPVRKSNGHRSLCLSL